MYMNCSVLWDFVNMDDMLFCMKHIKSFQSSGETLSIQFIEM